MYFYPFHIFLLAIIPVGNDTGSLIDGMTNHSGSRKCSRVDVFLTLTNS